MDFGDIAHIPLGNNTLTHLLADSEIYQFQVGLRAIEGFAQGPGYPSIRPLYPTELMLLEVYMENKEAVWEILTVLKK